MVINTILLFPHLFLLVNFSGDTGGFREENGKEYSPSMNSFMLNLFLGKPFNLVCLYINTQTFKETTERKVYMNKSFKEK